MKPLDKETQRHSTAFAYFLQLGGERSYAEVARRFGYSETSVRKWAYSFNWEQRVVEVDTKANAEQREKATQSYVQTVEDFRGLKDDLFQSLKARSDSGECSIMELISILRAVKVELGEPIHITAMPQQSETRNPFEGIFQSFFGERKSTSQTIASRA